MLIEVLKYNKKTNDWNTVNIYSEKIVSIEQTNKEYENTGIDMTCIELVSGHKVLIVEDSMSFISRLRYNIESADDPRKIIYGIS